jgi:putative hydrolase of the HAD superfamily
MIRAIIFDYFDVFRTDGYNRWLKQHGQEREGAFLTASEKHDRGDYSDKEFFQAIAEASGETAEQVRKELEADNVFNQPLVEYLRTLEGGYKLALLSNSASDYLRHELAVHDMEQYFDEIVISSEVGLIKPEPEVFEYIMQKLGVEPHECIFTDDNPKHISAAAKLGIHGIVYTSVPELRQQVEAIVVQQ